MEKCEIGLMHDRSMFNMVSDSIRGGLSFVNTKFMTTENSSSDNILYIDLNNMYGISQCLPLPQGSYKWEVDNSFVFDQWRNWSLNQTRGYIIECDLIYDPSLHVSHEMMPLAPEQLKINYDMLSPMSKHLLAHKGDNNGKGYTALKLSSTFNPRIRYVTHYMNLQYYLKSGLVLDKVHR